MSRTNYKNLDLSIDEFDFVRSLANKGYESISIKKGAMLKPAPSLNYSNDLIRPYGYSIKRNIEVADYLVYNNLELGKLFGIYKYKSSKSYRTTYYIDSTSNLDYLVASPAICEHIEYIVECYNNGYTDTDFYLPVTAIHDSNKTIINNIDEYTILQIEELNDNNKLLFLTLLKSINLHSGQNRYYISYMIAKHFSSDYRFHEYIKDNDDPFIRQYLNYICSDNIDLSVFSQATNISTLYDKFGYIDKKLTISLVVDKLKIHLQSFSEYNLLKDKKMLITFDNDKLNNIFA